MTTKPMAQDLSRLLNPRSIVFIGGRHLAESLRSCRSIGYQGDIWVVNPDRTEIGGVPCVKSLADLPGPPDAAFLAVPAQATAVLVAQLAAMGAGGAICYAAGFAERGAAGAALQRDLVAAAGHMPLVGPNCYGILNYLDGAALWADVHGGARCARGIAIVSQSGNLALNFTMTARSLPLARVISVGNQAAMDVSDFIVPLVDDPRIDAIGLYLEGLSDVPAFSRAAAYALAKGVPLVVLKVGRSEVASQLALTHTSSLVGEDSLYDALFQRTGVIRAPSLTAFLECLKLLALQPPSADGRKVDGREVGERKIDGSLGVLTCSGGDAALVADAAAENGLTIPPLSATQVAALRPWMSDFTTLSNPLDYNTSIWGNYEALSSCFGIVMEGAVAVTALVIDYAHESFPTTKDWDTAVEALINASKVTGGKAVAVASIPELLPTQARQRLIDGGVVPLQGLEEAIFALGASHWYGRRRADCLGLAESGRLAIASVTPLATTLPGRTLDEWDSKTLLKAQGVRVPQGEVVPAAAAATTAGRLGFPVVVKAVAADLAHKSDAGAVALNLESEEAVAEAVAAMSGLSTRFLVERMERGGVAEVIVGIKRDPQFGLVLVVGSGGVLVNLLDDAARLLLPLDRAALEAAIDNLKLARLLDGYRGSPPGDRAALLDMVVAIAETAEKEQARLLELDVNPIVVMPEGKGAAAVDALVRLADLEASTDTNSG